MGQASTLNCPQKNIFRPWSELHQANLVFEISMFLDYCLTEGEREMDTINTSDIN